MTSTNQPQPDAIANADLATDLRVLTGLRSRSAVRDRVLPALDARIGTAVTVDREARFAALQELIDTSIVRMSDPAHRHAAGELLGSGPNRWQPLTRRGPRASSAFQLGWDAYRRRRETTGASLLDETLDALAATIVGPDRGPLDDDPMPAVPGRLAPATVDAPPPEVGTEVHTDLHSEGRAEVHAEDGADLAAHQHPVQRTTRPKQLTAAIVACLVLLLAAFTLVRGRAGDGSGDEADAAAGAGCGPLTLRPGDAAPDAPDDLTTWSSPFRSAASEAVPAASCASAIGTRDGSIFQEIASEGSDETWLLLAPSEPSADVIVLNPHEHLELRSTVWASGRVTPIGPVVARAPDRSDGVRVVTLASGVLVQHHEDDRAFVIADRFYEHWLDHGGIDGELGRPLSNRYEQAGVGSVQDFARARLVADYEVADVSVHQHDPIDPAIAASLSGNVLRTPAGDAWFVTPEGQRRWLPTGEDLRCARESHGATIVDAAAAAVAAYDPGPEMRCL